MALRIASVTVDCSAPARLARFWAAALGYVLSGDPDEDGAIVEDPRDRDVELVFTRVDAEVQRLVGLGARRKERLKGCTVMQDPEGNEFCVVQIPADDPVELWRGNREAGSSDV